MNEAEKDLRDGTDTPLASYDRHLADFVDPIDWPLSRRLALLNCLGLATLALSFDSSAFTSSIPDLQTYLGATLIQGYAGVSLYVLGFAIGPLLHGPASEVFGRKPVYVLSYFGFFAFETGVAFANNIGGMLIMRFLAGFCGCSSLNNAMASIADVTLPRTRGRASIIFGLTSFAAPALGPLTTSFLANRAYWRWSLYLQAILAGLGFVLMALAPETHVPTLQRQHIARALRRKGLSKEEVQASLPPRPKLSTRLKTASTKPVQMFLKEPILIACCVYLMLIYGVMYALFAAVPYAFSRVRGWDRESVGLIYIALLLGFMLGAFISYFLQQGLYLRAEARVPPGEKLQPEARFEIGIIPASSLVVGLLIFGFTSYAQLHWFGQAVALVLLGEAVFLVFNILLPYLADCYGPHSASALAASCFTRSICAFAFPLFTTSMFERLTVPGGCALLAGISLLMAPLPLLFSRYGASLRRRSRYAPPL